MSRLSQWPLPFVLLLAAPGCGADPRQERSSTNATDGAAIVKRIGLTLPPSARIEYADYTAGMDDAARLLLVMSEADRTAFLRDIVRQVPRPPEFSEAANFALGTQTRGWNPTDAKGLKTGQVAWANETEGLNIGYAPAGADEVRMFLFWHQT